MEEKITRNSDTLMASAKDVGTSPQELDHLASSDNSEIRRTAAENPNTPFKTLWKLVGEFPTAILNNPIFELSRLRHPQTGHEMPSLDSPPEIFTSDDPGGGDVDSFKALRYVALVKAGRGRELAREWLCDDWLEAMMVFAVDANKGARGFPKDFSMLFLEAISQDPDSYTRSNLACCDGVPCEILLSMAKDGDRETRKVLAGTEDFEGEYRLKETHKWLAKNGDLEIRLLLADNAYLHPNTFDVLLEKGGEEIRVMIAGNPGLPSYSASQFLRDRNPEVRRAVVRNHGFCDELLSLMVRDPDPGVREATREILSEGMESTKQKAHITAYGRKLVKIAMKAKSKPHSGIQPTTT